MCGEIFGASAQQCCVKVHEARISFAPRSFATCRKICDAADPAYRLRRGVREMFSRCRRRPSAPRTASADGVGKNVSIGMAFQSAVMLKSRRRRE
jgi:hypothetical protein